MEEHYKYINEGTNRFQSQKPSLLEKGRKLVVHQEYVASHHFDVNSSSTSRLSKNPTKTKIKTLSGNGSGMIREANVYESKQLSLGSKYLTELHSQREGESSLRTADHMTSFMCSKFESSPEVVRFEALTQERRQNTQQKGSPGEDRKVGKKKKRIIAARGQARKYYFK